MIEQGSLVLRIKLRTLIIASIVCACALAALVAGTLIFQVVHALFGSTTVTLVDAKSPDGMYRVIVKEDRSPNQCYTLIGLYKHTGDSGKFEEMWSTVSTITHYNDSSCRSNYSIVWTLDPANCPTAVRVFGDFGMPPIKTPTELFSRALP